jgi:hypothetical protein
MATGSQKVKTPTGWNATRGAWVKTESNTWKDVDQIYIKTPSGWNNASGQEATQIPYPYIANAQNPFIRNAQQPYPYIANAQNPVIRNAQQPYPYIANAQSPYIAQGRQPSTYQHRSPLIYQNPVSAQEPNIRSAQEPNIRSAQEPNIRDARQPSQYNYRSPGTYRSPVNGRQPSSYQHRSPFTYRNPVNGRQPFTYNYRSPFTYRNPVNYQEPHIRNARSPGTYQNPVNAQQPNIRNARTPRTYRNPVNGREPNIRSGQTPFTYQARQPVIVQSPRNGQQPAIALGFSQQPYPYQTFPGGFGGGCFSAGSMVMMGDGTYSPIESLIIGNLVMSWNENLKVLEQKEIKLMMTPKICPIYDVEFSDGTILNVTDGHPLLLSNGQWGTMNVDKCVEDHPWMEGINTHEIIVGDKIMNETDCLHFDKQDVIGSEIISISENSEMEVYNVSEVADNHTYIVDGLVVHNLRTGNEAKR